MLAATPFWRPLGVLKVVGSRPTTFNSNFTKKKLRKLYEVSHKVTRHFLKYFFSRDDFSQVGGGTLLQNSF